MKIELNFQEIKRRLVDTALLLPQFLKNPILGMKNLPDWDWYNIIVLQLALVMSCGLLSGIVATSFLHILWGVFIMPIIAVIVSIVATGLLYYIILFLFRRELDFRILYINMFFASIPFLVFKIVTPIAGFLDLFGYAIAMLLLTVGLVKNFSLPKQTVYKLVSVFYVIFFSAWLMSAFNKHKVEVQERKYAEPQSLDLLQKELNENKE